MFNEDKKLNKLPIDDAAKPDDYRGPEGRQGPPGPAGLTGANATQINAIRIG